MNHISDDDLECFNAHVDSATVIQFLACMFGQRFRLNAPKIGIVFQDGRKVAVQIPAGAEILAIDSVPDPVVDRQQPVHVTWEGKTLTMFAVDIRENAEPILTETR
jgi:hypothetical protein